MHQVEKHFHSVILMNLYNRLMRSVIKHTCNIMVMMSISLFFFFFFLNLPLHEQNVHFNIAAYVCVCVDFFGGGVAKGLDS